MALAQPAPSVQQDRQDSWAQIGDPLADQVVLALRRTGDRQRDMLDQVRERAATEGGVFQDFWGQVHEQPEGLNQADLVAGQELFMRCAPLSIASFVLCTLPLTYTPPGSAKVLMHTGRLRQDVLKRLYETATMVQAIMSPGGMQIGHAGHQAILRVRLLHAMVRQGVLSHGHWPQAELGQPINQLQLSLTALGFSCVILRSLDKLGVAISPSERQSYQQLWRYANTLQGVATPLLPKTESDELQLLDSYTGKVIEPNDDSRTLTHSIFDALAGQAPFYLPKGALHAISRLLLGRRLADQLAIPERPFWTLSLRVVSTVHRWSAFRYAIPGWRAMEVRAGRRYFDRLIEQGLQGLPAYLQGADKTSNKPVSPH